MPTNAMGAVMERLRRAMLRNDGAGLTDAQLLDCFLSQRDEAAFAALVKRHGPMVWGVCRRILHNHHDAEDAFQATFLVLLRKAASIVPKSMVANWLHGVARQTALKARSMTARKRTREKQMTPLPEAATEVVVNDPLQLLLDQELSRLPDKYRILMILCDLEGKTRREAAQQLGVPEGTVAGRLARARAMLAKRMTRHGLTLSGGSLAAALAQNTAAAAPTFSLMSSTIQAATSLTAGQAATSVIPITVIALMEGVLKTMLLTKLKIATGVVLLAALTLGGVGVVKHQAAAVVQAAPTQEPKRQDGQPPRAKKEPTEREKALFEVAREHYEGRWNEFVSGKTTADFIGPWSAKLLKAQLKLCDNQADRLAAHKDHVERLRMVEAISKEKYDAGSIAVTQYAQLVYYRIEAEIWLEEAMNKK